MKKLDDTIQEVRDKQNLYLDAAFYNSIRSITASSHQTQSRELRLKPGFATTQESFIVCTHTVSLVDFQQRILIYIGLTFYVLNHSESCQN